MRQQQRDDSSLPRHISQFVPRLLIWPFISLIWIFMMVLLLWWQVPLFISLPLLFLGMGMYTFMIIHYIRSKVASLRDVQREQTQISDSPADPLLFPTSSQWDNTQLQQIQYPEQE